MGTAALRTGRFVLSGVLASILASFALFAAARSARADLLASCTAYDSFITCTAADVGKPCQGAGTCFAIGCGAGASLTESMVYRCGTCPTTVASDAGADGGGGCTVGSIGGACAGGGTCGEVPPYCPSPSKFVCSTPYTGPEPTGPPSGEADAGAAGAGGAGASTDGGADASVDGIPYKDIVPSSGCDIAPRPAPETLIGLGLVVVGVAFFVIDRKRKRRRNR